jgi:hypothetical protein
MDEEVAAIKETAKAVQEVAKTSGKAIDAGVRTGTWLDKMLGEAIGQTVAHVWTDRIKARRIEATIYNWERAEMLFHKAAARLRKKGVTVTRPIPPKVALPLLEYATVEHEDDLHTLWAHLMATGMDPGEDEIHRKYVTTLGEMTAKDAAVLAAMFVESMGELSKKKFRDSTVTYGPGIDGTHSHDPIAVITLNRLGLIEPASVSFKTFEPGGHDDQYGDYGPTQDEVSFPGCLESVVITPFGAAFGKAVGLDGADRPVAG